MEAFTGKVWVLGDDIDTDIIIPKILRSEEHTSELQSHA